MSALIWSIGKYTGDYGGIAGYAPVTNIGRLFATINGFLGLALFALPAGLLGSAFIDELGERKRKKDCMRIEKMIINAFSVETNKKAKKIKKDLGMLSVPRRIFPVHVCQAMLNLTDGDIYRTVGESANLRLRYRPGTNRTNVEYFRNNRSYGAFEDRNSIFTVVCTTSAQDAYIGHYTSAVAQLLGANYISVENFSSIEMVPNYNFDFSGNIYFRPEIIKASGKAVAAFKEFCADLDKLASANSYVLYFESTVVEGAEQNDETSQRKEDKEDKEDKEEKYQLHILAGGNEGDAGFNKHTCTVSDFDKFNSFYDDYLNEMKKIKINVFSHQFIGSFDDYHIHNYLRKRGCNVISILISTPLLTATLNKKYYGSISGLVKILRKCF